MKRREFITLVGGAAAWPLVARAQQPSTMKRIAIVIPNGDVQVIGANRGNPFQHALFTELERLGYVEGQNLVVDRYSGGGHLDRFDNLAREVFAQTQT
jgi:putative tryptophan/tyrosine transport system substrate-binding protein